MLTVTHIDAASSDACGLIAKHAVDEDYRAVDRFKMEGRRRQSLTCRALLRATLERASGFTGASWHLSQDLRGKPMVQREGGAFGGDVAMSHSADVAACAVLDRGLAGVDVEYCDPDRRVTEIAAAAFGDQERLAVMAGGPATFYRIWTLREAMAKASGNGMSTVMDRKDYFADFEPGQTSRMSIGDARWKFSTVSLATDYVLSVAATLASSDLAITILPFLEWA